MQHAKAWWGVVAFASTAAAFGLIGLGMLLRALQLD